MWAETSDAAALNHLLQANPGIRWVQLPWAGIEPYLGVLDHDRVWTSGKGVYAEPVAELALALLLAGLRGIVTYARRDQWSASRGTNLDGATARRARRRAGSPSRCSGCSPRSGPTSPSSAGAPSPLDGAARVVGADELDDAVDRRPGVVVALALTPETRGIIGRPQLERHGAQRVAGQRGARRPRRHRRPRRGRSVTRRSVAPRLDVTDPEPLPADHPLWTLPNAIITPHVGNTPRWRSPCSPAASPRTCAASPPASR